MTRIIALLGLSLLISGCVVNEEEGAADAGAQRVDLGVEPDAVPDDRLPDNGWLEEPDAGGEAGGAGEAGAGGEASVGGSGGGDWAGAGGDDWGGDGGWGGGSMADACWGGCFSNQDCAEGFICSDIDVGEPCCLEGVSEGLPVGAPCQAEGHAIECASSICIEGPDGPRCSDVCEAAEDCPQGMRRCERIPLSGSDERWCLFE